MLLEEIKILNEEVDTLHQTLASGTYLITDIGYEYTTILLHRDMYEIVLELDIILY